MTDPFSPERMNDVFQISSKHPDRLNSRESSTLEFKESFGWKSAAEYLRTCAAFANAKGGYIVFGIGNQPHTINGLDKTSLKQFQELDPARMTRHFNDHFSPEIIWKIQSYEMNDKTFGVLYITESTDKPVFCIRDFGSELKNGEIYYRYRGQSSRIKYPEFRTIIERIRRDEESRWLGHLTRMAKIGIRDVGILDLQSGQVSGPGGSFIIDESLLSQVSFIREGEFSETKGKPALKLIGTVESLGPTVTAGKIVKTRGIRLADIVLVFLKQEDVPDPIDYVTQICHEDTGFLPCYYFIEKSEKNVAEVIDILAAQTSRKGGRDKLLERLKQSKTQHAAMVKSGNKAGKEKKSAFDKLIAKADLLGSSPAAMVPYLQAMRMMEPVQVKDRFDYLASLLIAWFNGHYSNGNPTLTDNLRRAICWLDEAMFMEEVAK